MNLGGIELSLARPHRKKQSWDSKDYRMKLNWDGEDFWKGKITE